MLWLPPEWTSLLDRSALEFLKQERPDWQCIEMPGYNIQYASENMVWNMATQYGKIQRAIRAEGRFLKNLVEKEKIDLVISDNRYGCYVDTIPCILLTHQLNVLIPNALISFFVAQKNKTLLNQFTEVWIPDTKDHFLSGKLSQNPKIQNTRFIGHLSRFTKRTEEKDIDVLILLSGPEPQRTKLEEKCLALIPELKKRVTLVRGIPEEKEIPSVQGVDILNIATGKTLEDLIARSNVVLCRSGYSSLMDIASVGNTKVICIPTPGQTEQLFLAEELSEKKTCLHASQNDFNLQSLLEKAQDINSLETPQEKEDSLQAGIAFIQQTLSPE